MSYPASIDSFTANTDDVDDVVAADVNELQAAIVAIETELGTDPAGGVTDLKTRIDHVLSDDGYLELDDSTELTIASGAITVTQNYHFVDTESDAASDYLDTINGGSAGWILILRSTSDVRDIIIRHGVDNIYCATGTNLTLDQANELCILIYDDNVDKWIAGKLATGSTITGSGTTGQVAYMSATNTIGSDTGLTYTAAAGLVVNEDGGAALDVRCESDANPYMFFVDASDNEVDFGTAVGTEIMRVGSAFGVIINDGGGTTADLRVESDANAYMLMVDASANTAGFGTSSLGDIATFTPTGTVFNEAGAAGVDFRVESDSYDALLIDASENSIALMNHASGKVGFFATAPTTKQTALTTQLTAITHSAPGTPDYAIQDLTNTGGYGFVTLDEALTLLSVVANLQTRVGELETKLKAYGLLA